MDGGDAVFQKVFELIPRIVLESGAPVRKVHRVEGNHHRCRGNLGGNVLEEIIILQRQITEVLWAK